MLDFQLGEFCWQAKCQRECWAGFGRRLEAIDGLPGASTSDGRFQLVFAPEGRDRSPLSSQDLELVDRFLASADDMAPKVLEAVYRHYLEIFDEYAEFAAEEQLVMPAANAPADLRELISLTEVFIHPVEHEDRQYVGYEFNCTWETEHGLGVLMHGDRVVRVGEADNAFTLWMVMDDLEDLKASGPST